MLHGYRCSRPKQAIYPSAHHDSTNQCNGRMRLWYWYVREPILFCDVCGRIAQAEDAPAE